MSHKPKHKIDGSSIPPDKPSFGIFLAQLCKRIYTHKVGGPGSSSETWKDPLRRAHNHSSILAFTSLQLSQFPLLQRLLLDHFIRKQMLMLVNNTSVLHISHFLLKKNIFFKMSISFK